MRKINITINWISGGIVVFFLFVCSLAFSAEENSPLRMLVESSKEVYRLDEKIDITLSFKNIAKEQIMLFHPDSLSLGLYSWKLKCYITKPNGKKIILEPQLLSSIPYFPRKKDYVALKENSVINIPLKFSNESMGDISGWVGLIKISSIEDKCFPPKLLRWIHNIKGSFSYLGRGYKGKQRYLVLSDIIKDIFNIEGKYTLEFKYKNFYNTISEKSEQNNNKFIWVDIPNAWTGALSEKIVIEIKKD